MLPTLESKISQKEKLLLTYRKTVAGSVSYYQQPYFDNRIKGTSKEPDLL